MAANEWQQGNPVQAEIALRTLWADQREILGPEHQDALLTDDALRQIRRAMGSRHGTARKRKARRA
ncbi:hypothetical protein [Dactylosporangium sp. CA-139066]|uniref:hypothetical protein n=1 Tax=Dactylosporangium sp. CA-139066 TaxID=3239930 RepID=UPI003D8DDB7F